MWLCFSVFPRPFLCFRKKRKRVVISIITYNQLSELQKDIMNREYDVYFSELLEEKN